MQAIWILRVNPEFLLYFVIVYKTTLVLLLFGAVAACSSRNTNVSNSVKELDSIPAPRSSHIETFQDSVSKITFSIEAISALQYRLVKANQCDLRMTYHDSAEYSRILLRDASFVRIIDSNIIVRAGNKLDTFTTHTSGDPYYTDTFIYKGMLKCLNYAIVFDCMAEGMKLGTSLVNVSTGEILNARCNFAFSPSGRMVLSYQDRPIWGLSYEFTLFFNDKGRLRLLSDTMFGSMGAEECKWKNEKEFYVKQYGATGADTSYVKVALSGKGL